MSDDVAATEDWMVPAMILAIYQHRRRISVLLDRLDDPQRGVVEAAVSALDDGTVDPATLLAGTRDNFAIIRSPALPDPNGTTWSALTAGTLLARRRRYV